jgi:hypothetical protein
MLAPKTFRTLLLAALFVSLAGGASAQMYKYTDARGQVHFTDNPSLVPDSYRSQLEELDLHHDNASSDSGSRLSGAMPGSLDRFQPGHPEFEKLRSRMEQGMPKWIILFIAAGLVSFVITLGSVFHAFANHRILWGLANFFIGVSVPVYLLIHVERYPMLGRGLLVLGWGSPLIMLPLVLRAWMSMMVS